MTTAAHCAITLEMPAPAQKPAPQKEPLRLAFTLERVPQLGWKLVTLGIQGDRIVSRTETEPDVKAAQLGRMVQTVEKWS